MRWDFEILIDRHQRVDLVSNLAFVDEIQTDLGDVGRFNATRRIVHLKYQLEPGGTLRA